MTDDAKIILAMIQAYMETNPSLRVGQALVNLNIIQTIPNTSTAHNPYYDTDQDILKRTKVR